MSAQSDEDLSSTSIEEVAGIAEGLTGEPLVHEEHASAAAAVESNYSYTASNHGSVLNDGNLEACSNHSVSRGKYQDSSVSMGRGIGNGNHKCSNSGNGDGSGLKQCLTWSRITPSSTSGVFPHPRSGAASAIVRSKLYLFGGYGGGTGRLDDFHSFDFDTNTWQEVKVLSKIRPGKRENNGVVIGGGTRLYLFGGYNGSAWLNDLWMFDIETQRWECIQEPSDINTNADHAVYDQQAIDVAAGNTVRSRQSRGEVMISNNEASIGDDMFHIRPSRRFGYVSVVHEEKFILWGGFDGIKWLNDMYEFNFKTKVWRQIKAEGELPSVRSCPAWSSNENQLFIHGGYDGIDRKDDFFACDLNTYTWKEMPCLGNPPSPRYFHSCSLYGNRMFVYGGYSGSERLSDMYAYDFETNHWSEVDCSNGEAPSGRSSLVAQVYRNCIYIFGGYNGSVVLNDFYKFRLKAISIPPPSLLNDLRRLMNNPNFSDVVFVVEGKEIHANRSILAVRSEYFEVMLYNGMRESVDNNSIHLEDVSYSAFRKVLDYLYTDTFSNLNSITEGIQLLILSERFMIDRLKSLCEDSIRRDICISNVIDIFIASHR